MDTPSFIWQPVIGRDREGDYVHRELLIFGDMQVFGWVDFPQAGEAVYVADPRHELTEDFLDLQSAKKYMEKLVEKKIAEDSKVAKREEKSKRPAFWRRWVKA